MNYCVFSGFARIKEANPERHPAPERCRYASVVTCNVHHASHVEGHMHTTILGGLAVLNTNLLACVNHCHLLPEGDDFGSQPPQRHHGVHPHLL